jgi:polyphosphate kinase
LNERNPLLERLKFLSIFSSNLDEFFMIRVSGLKEEQELGVMTLSADGLTPNSN